MNIRGTLTLGATLLLFADGRAAELISTGSEIHNKGSSRGHSHSADISDDGRFITFSSNAPDLVSNDGNGKMDVFLLDRSLGEMNLISRSHVNGAAPDGSSHSPVLNSSGEWLAYISDAPDIVFDEAIQYAHYDNFKGVGRVPRAYLHDMATDTVKWMNPVEDGFHIRAQFTSWNPKISPDESFITLPPLGQSVPYNRWLLDSNELETGLYPYAADSFEILEHAAVGSERRSPVSIEVPYFYSADGSRLGISLALEKAKSGANVFTAQQFGSIHMPLNAVVIDRSSNNPAAYFLNLTEDRTALASPVSILGGLSGDGKWAVFEQRQSLVDTNGCCEVVIRDVDNLTSTLVSTNRLLGEPANGYSVLPVLSDDGNWIAYFSHASNLVANDTNDHVDVFLFDKTTQEHTLVSNHENWHGWATGMKEEAPQISEDGRYVLFYAVGSGIFRFDRQSSTCEQLVSDYIGEVPAMTPDGRFVSFSALPSTVDPEDANPFRNLYLHDFQTGLTELVSFRNTTLTDSGSTAPVSLKLDGVIADGRFVAFDEFSGGTYSEEVRGYRLWVRDTTTGLNTLASIDTGGNPVGNGFAWRNLTMSDDGQVLSFVTRGALSPLDTNRLEDVYVRDLAGENTELVSVNEAGTAAGNEKSFAALVSPNGRYVVFRSWSTNLNMHGGGNHLYLRDLTAETTRVVTGPSFGAVGNTDLCDLPVFSFDSSKLFYRRDREQIFVADLLLEETVMLYEGPSDVESIQPLAESDGVLFETRCRSISQPECLTGIYYRDLGQTTNRFLLTGAENPFASTDGSRIAFESTSTFSGIVDTNETWDVFVLRTVDQQVLACSINVDGTGMGNRVSRLNDISPDGRFVLFRSFATNLAAGDNNHQMDLFLRDTTSGTTLLLSRAMGNGGTANQFTGKGRITQDGTKVVFESYASDLAPGDLNVERDIFVAQLQLPDSDGDMLPDDWELAYFGNLDQDDTTDFDLDGSSDYFEFRSGTSPINSGSVLDPVEITSITTGEVTLVWPSVPGKRYRVEYKQSVNDPSWTAVPGDVTAQGTTASQTDSNGDDSSQRYYRVVIVE